MRQVNIFTCLFFFIALVFSSLTYSQTDKEQNMQEFIIVNKSINKSPTDDRNYQVIRLNNKLEVLLVSDPELKNSSASISVPIGSSYNPSSQLGLAHYLEHMLFLGSKRYPTINEYSKFMSQNGGYTNAYTSQESTVYGFEVNDSHYGEALDRLADVMTEPLFDENYADKERHTVNAEHQTYFDNDMRKFYAIQRYTLNPNHPMSKFSTGDLTSLIDKADSKLSDELSKFFKTYYSANLMKVALTTPQTIEQMQELAVLYLSQIPNNNGAIPEFSDPLITDTEKGVKVTIKPTANINLLQANFLFPAKNDSYMFQPGRYLSRLLGSDHAGGLSSHLIKSGLVESVIVGFNPKYSKLYSQFVVQFKLTKLGAKQTDQIMASLFSYIELIKNKGINGSQFSELKKSLTNNFNFLTKQSGFNYMMTLSANMQLYPNKDLLYFPYRLESFNKEKISQLLSQLTPENLRLFLLSPNAKSEIQIPFYNGKYSIEKTSDIKKESWLHSAKEIKLLLPPSNEWSAENFSLAPKENTDKAVHLIDQKGLSVWFKQSKYLESPKGILKVQLNNDLSDQNAASRMIVRVMLKMLSKQFSSLHFMTAEASLNFSVSSSNGLIFNTSGFSEKQIKLMLDVINKVKNASFTNEELSQAKQEIQRELNNKEKMKPIDLALDGFRQIITIPSWSDQELLDEITSVSLEEVYELIESTYSRSTLRILGLGNFTTEQILSLAESIKNIVKLQKEAFYKIKHLNADPDEKTIKLDLASQMSDDALASIYLSNIKGEKGIAVAQLLNKFLRPSFYDKIRTQDQLSYSPFALSFPVDDVIAFGLFTQSPVLNSSGLYDRFVKFLLSFRGELDSIEEQKFNAIKKSHIENYLTIPKTLGSEFSYLINEWSHIKKEIDTKHHFILVLNEITLIDLKALFSDLFFDETKTQQIMISVQGNKE